MNLLKLLKVVGTELKKKLFKITHKLAIPALRTAELTALTADCNELSN